MKINSSVTNYITYITIVTLLVLYSFSMTTDQIKTEEAPALTKENIESFLDSLIHR